MSVFHNNALIGASGGAAADAAPGVRSLRFNSSDSAYLSRTPSSAGNRRKWTWSGWVKRSAVGSSTYVLADARTGSNESPIMFGETTTDTLSVYEYSGSFVWQLRTTQVFRDPSAFFHLVVAVDTEQATASNRVKIYVNGSQVTDFAVETYPSQNHDTFWNTTNVHTIGAKALINTYFSGYLTDLYFIDGLQLTPTSFGSTDSNGVWQRGTYSGTFGTNGFHILDFENEATIGDDSSGNSNDFTANNLSDTAGAGNDVLLDFPANGSESDTGAGGEVSGNYCLLNPLDNGGLTLSNGNLDFTNANTSWDICRSSFFVSSGKWYWEVTVATWDGTGAPFLFGIANPDQSVDAELGQTANSWAYLPTGQKRNGGSTTSYGSAMSTGAVVGVALDMDAGTLSFYLNGSSQGQAFSSISGDISPAVSVISTSQHSGNFSINFGQRAFEYGNAGTNRPAATFKALCTANLATPTIADGRDYFDAKLWTGNSQDQRAITGYQFSPDWVWIKRRNASYAHPVMDTVRGLNSGHAGVLYTNTNQTEDTGPTSSIRSFNSDGFNLGTDGGVNFSGSTYVGWAWDAGSSTASNTDGTGATSVQVRANQTAGFSIITFTSPSTSTASYSVGHGLNAAPEFWIWKSRGNTGSWQVYFTALGSSSNRLNLNSTGAVSSSYPGSATSSVINLSDGPTAAFPGTNVIYAFAPVAGYSAFGSYTGTGSATNSPFVHLGFRARFILFKNTTAGENWRIMDTVRNTFNVVDNILYPNLSNAEGSSAVGLDILSNGFKIRESGSELNDSGDEIVYAAFAENPFQANGGLAR